MKTSLLLPIAVLIAGLPLLLSQAGPSNIAHPLPLFLPDEAFAGLDVEVYPLGWSADGRKLGLLQGMPNEAADERRWVIQVQDLASDDLLLDQEFFITEPAGIVTAWVQLDSEIRAARQDFGLVKQDARLHNFPLAMGKYRRDYYEVSLARERKKEPNFGYRGVHKATLTLTRNGEEFKVIDTRSWNEFYPLAVDVAGCLRSPAQDRLAVIVGVVQRGYEGPPHTRTIHVVGCRVGDAF